MHEMKRAGVPCAFTDGHGGKCRTPEGARANRALDLRYDRERRRRDPLQLILSDIRHNAARRAA
jgi:hypothetical protein